MPFRMAIREQLRLDDAFPPHDELETRRLGIPKNLARRGTVACQLRSGSPMALLTTVLHSTRVLMPWHNLQDTWLTWLATCQRIGLSKLCSFARDACGNELLRKCTTTIVVLNDSLQGARHEGAG